MASPVPNNAKGIAESLRVRSLAADARLTRLYRLLRDISWTKEGIAPTWGGIADQLNARNFKTRGNRGPDGKYVPKDWNGPRVAEALKKFGFDRKQFEGWREDAKAWAFEHGVSQGAMLRQLWHEWSWQESVRSLEAPNGKKLVFDPEPLFKHPKDWIPPWERYPDHPVRMIPAAPPAARIAHLWLGAFDLDEDHEYHDQPKRDVRWTHPIEYGDETPMEPKTDAEIAEQRAWEEANRAFHVSIGLIEG